jgi:protein TonB
MAGWTWDFKPEPNDKSSDTGKIVYQIVIDSEGYLSRIDVVSSTVSPDVERIYRQSVERLSYSKTDDYKPAPSSTGRVTFIIKAK